MVKKKISCSNEDMATRKSGFPLNKREMSTAVALKEKIYRLYKRANHNIAKTISALAKTIELKSHYTGEHEAKTVYYAVNLAKALGLSEKEVEMVKEAAMLHDLGKIVISKKILLKKGKLTKKEYEEIKRHPLIAADIVKPVQIFNHIIPLILYHHERWDGKGYPYGLKRNQIPIGAQVVSIADEYQALISNRPYRKAYLRDEAIKIIKSEAGTKFNPKIVKIFLKVIYKKR
ncbi:MAG: HD domain-containing protein [Candidatus Omnitrophica bacterium]|nr:HD domain-containing protein [Candidatus Omnitrophota bacterium]